MTPPLGTGFALRPWADHRRHDGTFEAAASMQGQYGEPDLPAANDHWAPQSAYDDRLEVVDGLLIRHLDTPVCTQERPALLNGQARSWGCCRTWIVTCLCRLWRNVEHTSDTVAFTDTRLGEVISRLGHCERRLNDVELAIQTLNHREPLIDPPAPVW